jgi:hypothetical protein
LPVSILCSIFVNAAVTAAPATQPVTQPTAPGLEVREWAVFVIDASSGKINPDGIVKSTIPAFVEDKRYGASGYAPPAGTNAQNKNKGITVINGMVVRPGAVGAAKVWVKTTADPNAPTPVGIIRLIGSADSKVDVTVGLAGGLGGGSFLGSWPKAEVRASQLLWRDLSIGGNPGSIPQPVDPDSWFGKLRTGDSSMLSLDKGGSDKFLMYDIEAPMASPLKVTAGKDGSVQLANTSSFPLHDLVIYRHGQQATAGDLEVASSKPVTTKPATSPIIADKSVATVQLISMPTSQPAQPRAPWQARMDQAGIDKIDQGAIDRMLIDYAYDNRMTAVYAMDESQLDKMLPLDVTPQPAKIKRFALVIIRNADPSTGTEIDDLITQLGDPDWSKRDAAYHALSAMGPAAVTKLTAAKNNPDLEVVWRAEKLLSAALKPK